MQWAGLAGTTHRLEATLTREAQGETKAKKIVQWVDTRAGRVRVIADVGSPLSLEALAVGFRSTFSFVLVVIAIVALTTLLVTVLVIRRAFKGLSDVASQASRIEMGRPGVRLPTDDVPSEAASLVTAINEALSRLDNGYEQHRRFLIDAAHELRTPVAILNARISNLPRGDDRSRLLEDASRLSNLTDLLLDLERIQQPTTGFVTFDLVPRFTFAGEGGRLPNEADEARAVDESAARIMIQAAIAEHNAKILAKPLTAAVDLKQLADELRCLYPVAD